MMVTDAQKIAATLDHWKRKLLDLTKRNRALNFVPSRVSTVVLVDELPGQVFAHLYLKEGAMRFKPTLPEPPKSARSLVLESAEQPYEFGDVEDGVELPAVEGQDEAPDPNRHSDDVLQARATPSGLDRSLRRLDEQSRSSVEEQGVNALHLAIGTLVYYDPLEPDRERRAPLVMMPATLERRSASAGYVLRAGDDPVVNPALTQYLKGSFGVELPALPDPAAMTEGYDLQALLDATAQAIKAQPSWRIEPDMVLSLFAFQKLAMYADIAANAERFASHPIIGAIVTRRGGSPVGLPDDVAHLTLDNDFPPEATGQVVDADSSQLRAIAAVARGHNVVLEGPPGTGKSQTITNLIGQALADGKTVLFVAEKMAALNVVHRRLAEAGFGEFCLELHSTKASKRDVLRSLKAALDASVQTLASSVAASQRLPAARARLTEYADAVHETVAPLGLSPFQAYGELGTVLDAPKLPYRRPVNDLTLLDVEAATDALGLLAQAAAAVGDPNEHPWRETKKTYYAASDLDEVEGVIAELRQGLRGLSERAPRVQQALGLPALQTLGDVRTARAVAMVIAASPGAPLGVLQSDSWNAPPRKATDLITQGRALTAHRAYVAERMTDVVLDADHADDVAFIEAKEAGPLRWLNFLSGRFRLVRKRWTSVRKSGYAPTLAEQAEDMKRAGAAREGLRAMTLAEDEGRALFGVLWDGSSSDWDALEGYVRWVVDFRATCVRHGLSGQAAEVAARPTPNIEEVGRLSADAQAVAEGLDRLRTLVGWPSDYLAEATFSELAGRLEKMATAPEAARTWAVYETHRARVAAGPAASLLEDALSGAVSFDALPKAFRRAFFQRWLDHAVESRSLLREFHTLEHEQRVGEFKDLDQRVLIENRKALVGQLRDRTQNRLRAAGVGAELAFLQREMNKQRAHAPIRRTLREAGGAVRTIKPCFLMSPLSVAQMLDGSAPPFDLVVFDEASQMTAEDAVGSIVRARQLVVVGDPNQLPPTNFFAVMAGQVTSVTDENGEPLVEDSESILEECLGAGFPNTRLKWHYRSREESLITFSNVSFYDSDLYTFPSVHSDAHARGLAFDYVADGVYEGKGLNLREARRVADAVVRHAKEHPKKSLGVGTFNLRQQVAIQDEIELRRRQDPSIEPFFSAGNEEPFFVKNLENIQGDERDVIFLSVTYGKDISGVLRHNFGPLNGQNGWRRLNVITTRAKEHMRVFSSMRGEDINLARTNSEGAKLLRSFLTFAERGVIDSLLVSAAADTESPFERDVFMTLSRRGLRLQPQVGVAGYRIDFGVLDDEVEGRFVCGLECDGAAYHSSQTARDRDRLRQQVLEGRGWTLHRIWSTDWFKDRAGSIERIVQLVERSKQEAREAALRPVSHAAVTSPGEEVGETFVADFLPALEVETGRQGSSINQAPPLDAQPYTMAKLGARQMGPSPMLSTRYRSPTCSLR
jgi:very-short-patch-repair endonuclease